MNSARRVSSAFAGLAFASALLLVASCNNDDFDSPTVTGILLKPAGGVVKVDLTDPPGAPQETTLDVYVLGSGFDDGSEATFMLDGVPNPKVSTNSNHYVSPDSLIANITIAVDADTALYDVEVLTTRGKKGIGVDLFRVVEKGQTVGEVPITLEFSDSEDDGVLSDSGYAYKGILRENGSLIFSTLEGARNETRELCFNFPAHADSLDGCRDALLTTGAVDGGMLTMDVGQTIPMGGQFIWASVEVVDGKDQPAEWYLIYGGTCDLTDTSLQENSFDILRISETEWTFEGANAVLCRRWLKGRFVLAEIGRFAMPFTLNIVRLP